MTSGVKICIWLFVLLLALSADHAGWSAIAGAGIAVNCMKWRDEE